MTVVCIHQPDFAPWLGFFDRLMACDLFVVLDNVQFVRRGWHHRDRIKTAQGAQWLTVPVRKKGRFDQSIAETEIDDGQEWRSRHLRTLESAYGRAPGFARWFPPVRAVYEAGHVRLMDLNMALIGVMTDAFAIEAKTVTASSLVASGTSNELLINILKAVGGDVYLSGTGARAYLDEGLFAAQGIRVVWQSFAHPVYPQPHGPFIPELSGLDCIFNCGADAARVLGGETIAPPGRKERILS